MKKQYIFPLLILLAFLAVGLTVINDYGASADEHIQIDAGHVIWRYLCLKFHREVPEPIRDMPDLHDFKNAYYGQAATFPTVILEALKGFSMDSSTVLRVRHYWNFICYFIGLCCFTLAVTGITGDARWSALWLLIQILLPRIFGDTFYNDRDIMLISWMMIFLSSFYLFVKHPGWLTALLSAATLAVAVNTRIFGLTLAVFPFFYFIFSERRKYMALFIPAAILIWFALSPIAWDNPLHIVPDAIRHLATQQRYLDTGNEVSVLFFGKHINETQLPWYYIPLYIIVTTPLVTLFFAIVGLFTVLKRIIQRQWDLRTLFGAGMLVILIGTQLTGIIFHLTFYNGWRHFYYLFLPITWLSLEGVRLVWTCGKRIIQTAVGCMLAISFVLNAIWIAQAHPYQIIYLNPAFRSKWIGKFDRDYWILSTTECMDHLLTTISERDLNVVDKQALIEYVIIGFTPEQRERFHTMYHGSQPVPFEFLIYNYNGESGNNAEFDYYVPIYAVERDGIKLAEIFRRSHNYELDACDIVTEVITSNGTENAGAIVDSDFSTGWYTDDKTAEITLRFDQEYEISGMEVFPADGAAGFPNAAVFISPDGVQWEEISTNEKGSNGIGFQSPVSTEWLKLSSDADYLGIQDILFYGAPAQAQLTTGTD